MATKKKPTPNYYGEKPETMDGHPFYGITLDKEQLDLPMLFGIPI